VALAPLAHAEQDRPQARAERGQLVFDARRHLRVDRARDQAVLLELAQLGGQHALGAVGQLAAQLAEAELAVEQPEQHDALPAAPAHAERGLDRAVRAPIVATRASRLVTSLFDSTCGHCAYLCHGGKDTSWPA